MMREMNFKEFLRELLDGELSPISYSMNKWYFINYIKENSSNEIGNILLIELKLKEDLYHFFSMRYKLADPHIRDFSGEYEIIYERMTDASEANRKLIEGFISKEEEDQCRNISVLFPDYEDLVKNVLASKELSIFNLHHYDAAAYNSTFKARLYFVKEYLSNLTTGDSRYSYYKIFLEKKFSEYQKKIESECTNSEIKANEELISFYVKKFNSLSTKSSDKNISLCYGLIEEKLEEVNHHLNKYFTVGRNKKTYNKNLEWNGSIEKFTEFFDSLINSKNITYKESSDAFPIYKILLLHFDFSQSERGVNIGDIIRASYHVFGTKLDIEPGIKLRCKLSRELFASTFSEILNTSLPDKSSILYEGECNIAAIAIRLHKIFEIISKKRPYTEITPGSLNKKILKALNSK